MDGPKAQHCSSLFFQLLLSSWLARYQLTGTLATSQEPNLGEPQNLLLFSTWKAECFLGILQIYFLSLLILVYWFLSLLLSLFHLFKIFLLLLIIHHLHLLQNTDYVPCVLQYILEPTLYLTACTSCSPIPFCPSPLATTSLFSISVSAFFFLLIFTSLLYFFLDSTYKWYHAIYFLLSDLFH